MAVFDGVCYSLSSSLSPARKDELASVLDLNGAVPHPPYTHLIALAASHAHNNATTEPSVKLVTDRWVDRSVVLGKRQPEQYYSPDPTMIFSGVVACATEISSADLEVLSAGITALGGQWRIGLTRDVTHLFALRTGSDKYNTAAHFAPQTHMCILTPHWFDDSVRLGHRVPEAPYSWPDPLVLRPGVSLDLGEGAGKEGKRRRKVAGDGEAEAGDVGNVSSQGGHVRVWAGRRILLSTSLELGESSRAAIEAGIQRAGGVIVPIADDADEDVEEQAVDGCDVFITRWRNGRPYFKAARASLLIGTLTWLFGVESSGTLHSPLDSLLWYPTPKGGILDLVDCEISITNYTGAARDYLKRLIVLVGAKFTPSMSQSNKVLVAGFQPSPKTNRALSWSIPVVNHTWLEDCFVQWRSLTVGLERYIVYPPGVDFGNMLMTRPDGPPSSQSISTPRLSGGAVPGGRGVGTIDVQQEEARDAEYRARALKEDGSSMDRPGSEPPTEVRERAGSVKRTPSVSSARVKRGPMSTPVTATASAMGMFVDHVVELRTGDDDDDVGGGGRHTPTGGKRRLRTPVTGSRSRATPRSGSRASSAGLFSAAMEDDVVTSPLEGNPKSGKGKNNVGKPLVRPTNEAVEGEDDDVSQLARSSKTKPRSVQRRTPDARSVQKEDEAGKQAPARLGKSRGRAGMGATVGSDSDWYSGPGGGEESDVSVPPRRAGAVGSKTPVKSGMKPNPRSSSISRPDSALGRQSEDDVRVSAAVSKEITGAGKGREQVAKQRIRDQEATTKTGEKEKGSEGKKEAGKLMSRGQPPLSTSADGKNVRTPKRRLSVLVPSVPNDYFSSQNARNAAGTAAAAEGEGEQQSGKRNVVDGVASVPGSKQLAPGVSDQAVSAEVPAKRNRGRPPKSATALAVSRKSDPGPGVKPKSKPGPKPGGRKETSKAPAHDNDDGDEEMADGRDGEGTSMIIETSSAGHGGPRRSAAAKATVRLREKIIPDVISFEKEQKMAKRKRSTDWESVASVRGQADAETGVRNGKKRKVQREEEEEEEEVEVVVSARPKSTKGKANGKGKSIAGSDEGIDGLPAKDKPSGYNEKKGDQGRGKGTASIRLITTGVTLTDEVVKRLSKLGVQMTTKPLDCTHLIAKGIMRTEKFLCAMTVSPYFLGEEWANASAKTGKLLPEKNYLLTDAAAEKKWGFKFVDVLKRAKELEGGSRLFKSMTFYVTPKVAVDAKLLKNIVSAGGGQVQTLTLPTARILTVKANRYVVSCEQDKAIWRPLAQEGFKVYSTELVLRSALRQEIEWEHAECLVSG